MPRERIENKCPQGHELTEENSFFNNHGNKCCKICRRVAVTKYRNSGKGETVFFKRDLKKLGWTVELFEATKIAQNNLCAICKQSHPSNKKRLSVDHDHDTNMPRGLLCSNCNAGLGMFKDNSYLLELAAIYLRKYGK
jgi:hypothetical protein